MLKEGDRIAGYEIRGVLGRGGMGVVYEATQIFLDRPVALKLISPELSDNITFAERFRREGRLQAAVEHPHIVSVYEAEESDEGLYIAMQLVRGSSLKELIRQGDLTAKRALDLLTPVASALEFAHTKKLVHRDLKPQNILVGPGDHPYLADFGLTSAPGERTLTETDQVMGTVDYISPEQINGKKATDKSDVYSLAGVLYEALTGSVPFPRDNQAAVIYAHIADEAPKPSAANKGLPSELDGVLAKGMAKEAGDRFSGPTELLREAGVALGEGNSEAETPRPTPAKRKRKASKRAPTKPFETQPDEPPDTGPEQNSKSPTGRKRAATKSVPPPPRVARGQTTAEEVKPAKPKPGPVEENPDGRSASSAVSSGARRLAAAAAFVVLAAGGFLVGSSGGNAEPALANSASAGNIGVEYPDDWGRAETGPEIPGIEFGDRLDLTAGGGSGGLSAGTVDASGQYLLPAAFVEALGKKPEKQAVQLGDNTAYLYEGLRPKGFPSTLDMFVVPTAAGVATLGCFGNESGGEVPLDCKEIAESLVLTGTNVFPVGPDPAYAKIVNKTLASLNQKRKEGRAELDKASTPEAQASASGRLSDDFAAARAALPVKGISPEVADANAAIRQALQATSAAYADLASAAEAGSSSAYEQASQSVKRAEASVVNALGQLEELGYTVEA